MNERAFLIKPTRLGDFQVNTEKLSVKFGRAKQNVPVFLKIDFILQGEQHILK